MSDDEIELLRASLRRFVQREILPNIDRWEEEGQFPGDLYRQAGEAGFLGLGFAEEDGGMGEDPLAVMAMTEELMRCGSGGLVASLGSLGIGLPPIARWGSAALKKRVMPEVLRGEKIIALAVTEPGGGSDVAHLQTRARREGDEYVVSGQKTFITSGCRADYLTVAVRTGEPGSGGISLLLIETDRAGLTRSAPLRKMGWWASDTAELFFDELRVPADQLIGPENGGFYVLMSNFQMERLSLAVMAAASADMALQASLEYAQQREAFGRKIASFQVLKHKLAEMATQVAVCRQYNLQVARNLRAGVAQVMEVSMAKNFATSVCDRVTYDAVQIFGGAGYMRGTLVERLYRDARILSIGGGTYEIMNELIARQLGL